MSCKNLVRFPVNWCVPLSECHKSEEARKKHVVDWCVNTGVATKLKAEKMVSQLNPFLYMATLFPKVNPDDAAAAELYLINASLIVGGYIVDDVLETYSVSGLEELDRFFRFTEGWVSKLSPDNYPKLDEILCSLSEIKVPYSKAVICMFIDNFNKYCYEIFHKYTSSVQTVGNFRKRLSSSVTAYFEMALAKGRKRVKVDEKEFLWQRSGDNLGFPVLMLTEVISGLLQKESTKIPQVITIHYFHMYSNLFAHVLNDLNSYYRDVATNHNNLVKLWLQNGIATDFDDAAIKIVEFLNSVIINIHKYCQKLKREFSNSTETDNFLESIKYTFTGWVHVHTTAVERYRLSPHQITLAKVESGEVNQWLQDESEFGKRCVQLFDKLLKERQAEYTVIYGME